MSNILGGLAPWYGSKRSMAPIICDALGPHKAYWEPFCGSMAVLFGKPKCRLETVNDLHGDLINLAKVVRCPKASRELYEACRLTPCSDDILAESNAIIRKGWGLHSDCLDVERAAAYLAASWMARNGMAGLGEARTISKLCVRWGNGGGAPGTRWNAAIRSIGAWHRRLEAVTILRRDAFEVIRRINDESDAVIYVDPPYLIKADKYEHDFDSVDHDRLAESLARFKKARVVLSYYAHERLETLYKGWQVMDCTRNKNLSHTSGGKSAKAPEILLINQKSGGGLF